MKMTNQVVADSSGIISLASLTDSNHKKALKITRDIKAKGIKLIIPGDIVTETLNITSKKFGRAVAVALGDELFSSTEYTIVETTEQIRHATFMLFQQQPTTVSFADCLVMAFTDYYETKLIFGFDAVFAKNGYMLP